MYQKILAPLDGSNLAECTLGHIKAVATGCSVPQVILLFVIQPNPSAAGEFVVPPVDMEGYQAEGAKRYLAGAEDYLKKTTEALQQGGVNTSWAVVHGIAGVVFLFLCVFV